MMPASLSHIQIDLQSRISVPGKVMKQHHTDKPAIILKSHDHKIHTHSTHIINIRMTVCVLPDYECVIQYPKQSSYTHTLTRPLNSSPPPPPPTIIQSTRPTALSSCRYPTHPIVTPARASNSPSPSPKSSYFHPSIRYSPYSLYLFFRLHFHLV